MTKTIKELKADVALAYEEHKAAFSHTAGELLAALCVNDEYAPSDRAYRAAAKYVSACEALNKAYSERRAALDKAYGERRTKLAELVGGEEATVTAWRGRE